MDGVLKIGAGVASGLDAWDLGGRARAPAVVADGEDVRESFEQARSSTTLPRGTTIERPGRFQRFMIFSRCWNGEGRDGTTGLLRSG